MHLGKLQNETIIPTPQERHELDVLSAEASQLAKDATETIPVSTDAPSNASKPVSV